MTDQTTDRPDLGHLAGVLPFAISALVVVLSVIAGLQGGWWLFTVPIVTIGVYSLLDTIGGLNEENADPTTGEDTLYWFRMITVVWFPVQFIVVYGLLWYVTQGPSTLGTGEKVGLFMALGVMCGGIGIVYAHELMHQGTRLERWMGDLLMCMVMYGHFRSEHLLVHHRYVGTPRDPVTARYNEGFHRFYPRVLRDCFHSAWRAEAALLSRKGKGPFAPSNPFWRYAALQLGFLVVAFLIGGFAGVALFLVTAGIAVLHLEVINYIEHYGLTRLHLGEGKYEHVKPHHSWNANHQASNWLLINLQRHSDHHYRPNRRYPLLQAHTEKDAPQLPFGYPVMFVLALIPPAWRRIMNPRVRAWRKQHYPEVTDWSAYRTASTPPPRGAP